MSTREENMFGRDALFRVKKLTNRVTFLDLIALKDDQTPFSCYDSNFILISEGRQKQTLALAEGELLIGNVKIVSEEEKSTYIRVEDGTPSHGVYLAHCPHCNTVLEKDKRYQEASCNLCGYKAVRKYSSLYCSSIF